MERNGKKLLAFWTEKQTLNPDELRTLYEKGIRLFEFIYNDLITDKQQQLLKQKMEDMDLKEIMEKW